VSADAPILYDWSGAPVASAYAPITGRPGTALPSPAGGMVALGSDYATTPKAQVPHVDSNGTMYVQAASPTGASAYVYTGQTPTAAAAQYGPLTMGRQDTPTPGYQPLTFDMNGNLYVHPRSKTTARAIVRQVTTAANKYLAVVVNGSASTVVLRLYEINIYCTPGGTAGSLLGSSNSAYYPLICEIYRVSASSVTAGTTVTPSMCDTADTLATGVSVMSSPTISSYVTSLYKADAYISVLTGTNFYARRDANEKSLVMRPGEGMAVICMSSGTLSSAAGGTTSNAPVDVTFVFTQAPA
jgi:hypothetical protein